MSNENIKNSEGVYNSNYVYNSNSVYNSRSVYNSNYVYNSNFVRFLYQAYFCYDIGFKEYVVFNKEVGEERFIEIYTQIENIMQPNLQMKTESFTNEWKNNVTKEQWVELSKIPEFDRKVVENIVGFELPLEDTDNTEELTMEDVCKELGRTVKIKK